MLQQLPVTGPFRKYIVIDVLSDLSIDREVVADLHEKIDNNSKFAETTGKISEEKEGPVYENYHVIAPRNSVIAKLAGSNQGKDPSQKLVIMYPFFSSHISLAVKPGEVVWGFSETDGKIDTFYWVTRIHGPNHVEDTNYTHNDRKGTPSVQQANEIFTDENGYNPDEDVIEVTPRFPNGSFFDNRSSDELSKNSTEEDLLKNRIDIRKFTLPYINSYENIVTGSYVFEYAVKEPVPRLSKRPGDVTFQGSNNTAIILGTERGYQKNQQVNNEFTNTDPSKDSNPDSRLSPGSGAIDIVVGRGRFEDRRPDGLENIASLDPARTQPKVIKNSRDEFETHKNIGVDSEKAPDGSALYNVSEGDPDFNFDAARIYMSMKSSPDSLFGLTYPALEGGNQSVPAEEDATIVIKSDQIRVISRKEDTLNPPVNGSIRIIKEGTEDVDRATIVMEPDGTIMIDGPKIIIGSGFQGEGTNSEGTQVAIGRDASESLVLGNTLGEQLCKLLGAIVTNQAAFSVGASPNVLNPAIVTAATEVLTALGGSPAGEHTPTRNTTLSKVGKTK